MAFTALQDASWFPYKYALWRAAHRHGACARGGSASRSSGFEAERRQRPRPRAAAHKRRAPDVHALRSPALRVQQQSIRWAMKHGDERASRGTVKPSDTFQAAAAASAATLRRCSRSAPQHVNAGTHSMHSPAQPCANCTSSSAEPRGDARGKWLSGSSDSVAARRRGLRPCASAGGAGHCT